MLSMSAQVGFRIVSLQRKPQVPDLTTLKAEFAPKTSPVVDVAIPPPNM